MDDDPNASRERTQLLSRLDRELAALDALVPLSEQRFLDTHVLYEGRSDQQRRIIEWFGARFAPRPPPGRAYRVLSVGSGSGILDVPVAARLAEAAHALDYVGVDPSRVECERFAQAFRAAAIAGARLDVVPETFEASATRGAFDLVHLVHCLYYMPDPAAALVKARRLLAPGGRLVLFVAPCAELNDLARRFYDKQYGRPTFFADDVAVLLEGWGWSFEREWVDARVEVTPLVRRDPDVGLALRDFIVQVDSAQLPEAVQSLVDRYLHLLAEPDGGRTFIAHPVEAFVIGG